jgi:hypothetical protein
MSTGNIAFATVYQPQRRKRESFATMFLLQQEKNMQLKRLYDLYSRFQGNEWAQSSVLRLIGLEIQNMADDHLIGRTKLENAAMGLLAIQQCKTDVLQEN